MSIILNGTTLSDVTFNGIALDKIICNGVTVFEKIVVIREPASGEYYFYQFLNPANYLFGFNKSYNYSSIIWAGQNIVTSIPGQITSYSDGTYTYYRGTYREQVVAFYQICDNYGIYRIKN